MSETSHEKASHELRQRIISRRSELGDAGHNMDIATRHLQVPLHAPVDAYVDRGSLIETKPHTPDVQPQPISEVTVQAVAGPAVQLTVIEDMQRLVDAQAAVDNSFNLRESPRDTDGDGYIDFIRPDSSSTDDRELVNA
jgi:hypothetical protein